MNGQNNITCPAHYTQGEGIEPIKYIMSWNFNFNLGNVVKYITRAGRKRGGGNSRLQDLQKAQQYIAFEIEEEERRIANAQ